MKILLVAVLLVSPRSFLITELAGQTMPPHYIEMAAWIHPDRSLSEGTAKAYLSETGELWTEAGMSGNLTTFAVDSGYYFLLDYFPWISYNGMWDGTVSWSSPAKCFEAAIVAQTWEYSDTKYSGIGCVNPGWGGGGGDDFVQDPTCDGLCTPLVLDIGGDGYRFSSATEGVWFDIDGDGRLDRVSWPLNPSAVAFLAFDSNGNGRIDDASELFGDSTLLVGSGQRADNGFIALAQHDHNADGRIDSSDPIWEHLLLWHDANRDGYSQADELIPIKETAVKALLLDYKWSGRRDQYGNQLRYSAMATVETGEGGRHLNYYDIFLTRH
jgi:hypothetical protein